MKLICEENWEGVTPLIEQNDSGGKDFFIISECGIQVDLANKNKRYYPGNIVEKELECRYIPEIVNSGRAWGELGHPTNAIINEDRISHRFVEIKKTSPNYYSTKAKIRSTPSGMIIKALIEDNEGKLGQSTRAVGSVFKSNGGIEMVKEDLHFVTAGDIVADPSAQKAFVAGIYEGKEYEWDKNGILIEHIVSIIDSRYKINESIENKNNLFINAFGSAIKLILKKM